jgi:ATP-dependent Clp protease protease subunit
MKYLAEKTGQKVEKIAQDSDRDYSLSAPEAAKYGLVGRESVR